MQRGWFEPRTSWHKWGGLHHCARPALKSEQREYHKSITGSAYYKIIGMLRLVANENYYKYMMRLAYMNSDTASSFSWE